MGKAHLFANIMLNGHKEGINKTSAIPFCRNAIVIYASLIKQESFSRLTFIELYIKNPWGLSLSN